MTEQYQLPDGLLARPATLDDVDNAVELFNAFAIHTIGSPDYTPDELKTDWTSPSFSLADDSHLVLDEAGKAVGYVDVAAYSEIPVNPFVWGCTHPEYEGRGIGRYLMSWAEQRAHKVLDEVPKEARVIFQSYTVSDNQAAKRLYERFGMSLFRHSLQMRVEFEGAPPAAQWPEGITIKTYQHPEQLEAVYRADDEAFQDHFGYVPKSSFKEGFERFQHHTVNDDGFAPELWFVAWDGDDIAGVSLCRKSAWEDPNLGWVHSLGVRRPWRKRGLGLALLLHSFKAFHERGYRKVGLDVDAGNLTGALRLYTNAGMQIHRQTDRYEKEIRPGVELSVTDLEETKE
ncbi:MAG: GNAT family N-acetyltransferase [Chloroflexi bacterium]|nr:MAG: GNAT family N-acetyltransferase [Chloroflexota bacterium]MBL1195252.1 GNAT family N-acetyltransferase [Chloroflexota bacterium]NOH12538.1 GNAT family N-acetyltransferase [Chloroflexota bacterium]